VEILSQAILDRQILRNELLQDLYDYFFNNKGRSFRTSRDELEMEIEKGLAYDYLAEKGLITMSFPGGRQIEMRITAYGIDQIEGR
jgi:hypothetical protein